MKRSGIQLGSAFFGAAVFTLGALTGCSSTQPSRELVDARATFARAQSGPASQLAPTELHEAKQALVRAEEAYAEDASDQEQRALAYIAHRRALLAQSRAGSAIAQRQGQMAEAQYQDMQQRFAQQASGQLRDTREQLEEAERQAQSERQARIEAEQRSREAMQRLEGIANVREDPRGTVITLSGSVLFASGKSELMGKSRDRLNQVAEVLRNEDRRIRIVGHTDSQGSEEVNQRLSQQRAESVRDHLIAQGVPADRITVEGRGEDEPVADNASPEGRANNRRVEIILEGGSGQGGQQQGPGTTQPGMQQPGMQRGGTPQGAPGGQGSPGIQGAPGTPGTTPPRTTPGTQTPGMDPMQPGGRQPGGTTNPTGQPGPAGQPGNPGTTPGGTGR
jgi:outer membrane protein OmpA-like peptidoglycan-associated protein